MAEPGYTPQKAVGEIVMPTWDISSKGETFVDQVEEAKQFPIKVAVIMYDSGLNTNSNDQEAGRVGAEIGVVIATEELDAMNVSPEVREKALPIIAEIVQDSFLRYWNVRNNEDDLDKAPGKASEAGLERASKLVRAILGKEGDDSAEDLDAKSLVSKLDLQTMIDSAIQVLGLDLGDKSLDKNYISKRLVALANEKGSHFSDDEKQVVQHIIDKPLQKISPEELQALKITATGVHDSWAGIQPLRSMIEQGDKYQPAMEDLGKSLDRRDVAGLERVVNGHDKLRIFKGVFRNMDVMQHEKFKEGADSASDEDENDKATEEGLVLAIFEVLKDLVKIGLPAQPAQ